MLLELAHEDINLITLLVAGSEPGLQAQDKTGKWHDVSSDPGMITINNGDMLAMASENYFPSTPHRVINPEGKKIIHVILFQCFFIQDQKLC